MRVCAQTHDDWHYWTTPSELYSLNKIIAWGKSEWFINHLAALYCKLKLSHTQSNSGGTYTFLSNHYKQIKTKKLVFYLMFIFTDWFLQRTNILGCLSVFVGGEGGVGVGWGVAAGESHRRWRASCSESHLSLTPVMMITGEKGKRGGLSLKRHRWALLRSWLGVRVKELRRF